MSWAQSFYLRNDSSLYKHKRFVQSSELLNDLVDSDSES